MSGTRATERENTIRNISEIWEVCLPLGPGKLRNGIAEY